MGQTATCLAVEAAELDSSQETRTNALRDMSRKQANPASRLIS